MSGRLGFAFIGGGLSGCDRVLVTLGEQRIRELTCKQGIQAEYQQQMTQSEIVATEKEPFHVLASLSSEIATNMMDSSYYAARSS
jgi:hypothetical protein